MSLSVPTARQAPRPVDRSGAVSSVLIAAVVTAASYYLISWATAPSDLPGSYFYGCGYKHGLANVALPMALAFGLAFGFLHVYLVTARRAFCVLFALCTSVGMIAIPALGVTVFATPC